MSANHARLCLATLALVCVAIPAWGSPIIFKSSITLKHISSEPGISTYQVDLWSHEYPYREIYINLDPDEVTPADGYGVGPDVKIMGASLKGISGVSLYLASDGRAISNINSPRWNDENQMDGYKPEQVSPLPDDTKHVSMLLFLNRDLDEKEIYQVGYWAGDLRGMMDPNSLFTESDGMTIPEPGSLVLAGAGLASLIIARRKRSRL